MFLWVEITLLTFQVLTFQGYVMSTNNKQVQYAYGVGDALLPMAPVPIKAQRAPTNSDLAQIGATWIDLSSSTAYTLTNITANQANWSTSPASGVGIFTSLTVNPGNATITAGNLTVSAGDVDISAGNLTVGGDLTLGGSINLADLTVNSTQPILLETSDNSADAIDIIADGGASEEITIWSKQGTADDSILLRSDFGGVALFSSRGSGTGDISLTAANGGQIYLHGVLGDVLIESSGTTADAINLTSSGGIVASSSGDDISVTATGYSINLEATESVSDAIVIQASGVAGGIILEAGSSGIAIGNQAACPIIDLGDFVPTSSRLITVAGGTVTTAVTDRVDIAVDGVSTNAGAVKQVDIASGNVLLGTSTVNINSGTAASGTSTVNISTGTGGGTKAVNIGNVDGLTAITVHGSTVAQTAGSTFDIDAAGALSLNSSAAAINVGNDAVAQAINIGTGAAARTLTIGNVTGATAVNVNAGTGGFNVTSNGITTFDVVNDSAASPTATVTIDANVGMATFTAFSTAAGASEQFTITNSLVSSASSILVSIANEGANDAQMTVTRIERGAGSFVVTATNNGAAALNGDVSITFFVLS